MFSKKYQHGFFSLLMSATMAFIMTGIITAINVGVDPHFIARWLKAFVLAWPMAFLIVLLLGPTVRGFAQRICNRE
ncbi:MAG: DUF2798 domain-containing protein [Gammaproteobacteria bacterium]|nr:DUF2798 domain-containing protein [Gammaproteobacteria bacterium]